MSSTADVRLVRCHGCGKSEECSPGDMLRYTRQGWPRCCGEIMTLFTQVEKPAPDAAALDENRTGQQA